MLPSSWQGSDVTRRQGEEEALTEINPQSQKDTTLPDWGSRDLKIGTPQSAGVSTGRTSVLGPRAPFPGRRGRRGRHTITEPICRVPTTSPPSPAMSLVR